jgi:SAM-dependent methyltransferase
MGYSYSDSERRIRCFADTKIFIIPKGDKDMEEDMKLDEEVRSFYDTFSYPYPSVKSSGTINGVAYLRLLDLELGRTQFAGCRILDAGCGTGHRTIDIARQFPEANVLGIDLSPRSIQVAIKQAGSDGVSNVSFQEGDLLQLADTGKYDLILANGVLHHLLDPAAGLRCLAEGINEKGALIVWLFHTYGEHDRLLQRRAIKTLLQDDWGDLSRGLSLIRGMNLKISRSRYGRDYSGEVGEEDEAVLDADAFLNPRVRTFHFEEALALLTTSHLEWGAVEHINYEGGGSLISLNKATARPWTFNTDSILPGDDAKRRFEQLPIPKQLKIIEQLVRPTGFTLVAGGAQSLLKDSTRVRSNVAYQRESPCTTDAQ